MCSPQINGNRNINLPEVRHLREARALARSNPGSEAIVKQNNGNYSVVPLKPEDVARVRNTASSNFAPNNVEFMVQGNNGSNEVVINDNASFFNRAKSQALNGVEFVREEGRALLNDADKARTNIMTTIDTLYNNLSDRNNNYVFGGRGDRNFDPNRGVSNVDCSGLLNEVFKKSGVNIPYMSTEALDTYIKNGTGVLTQNNNAASIKYGDVINYPPQGRSSGHVMIAAGEPVPVTRNNQLIGYRLNTFDSSPDNSGTRRAEGGSAPQMGARGAGFREIFLFVDSSGKPTGLNTMGHEARTGGYHGGVRVGSLKENLNLSR